MIGVTGASGKLGRLVIEGLLETVPARQIAALVRNPDKVADLSARGVMVRFADYALPETLGPALVGVKTLMFVSSNELMKDRAAQHRAVIEAARKEGVQKLVYTSILKANNTSVTVLKEHQNTEKEILKSGIPFVILRNGWYIENYTDLLPVTLSHGAVIGSAGQGKIAAASRADFAAAAVTVLTEPGHTGQIYELAGTHGFTKEELAKSISEWAHQPVTYRDLPPEDYNAVLSGSGLPGPIAAFLTEADIAIANNELNSDTSDLPSLIGRDPRSLDDVLQSIDAPVS